MTGAFRLCQKRSRHALLLAGVLIGAACSGDLGPADADAQQLGPGPTSAISGTAETTDAGDASISALTATDSGYLFDQEVVHTFGLEVSDDDLALLDADPVAEQYVPATLIFEGETIAEVGLRYKGSVGAFVGCLDGPHLLEPSGSKTCTKLSMKVKINFVDPDRELHGVRRLQFHSQNLDPSLMHERLGYWLFAEMGVPAPRSTPARVLINGDYVGLFALTEQIDGRLTRRLFADGTGNLYKEVWPVDQDGQGHGAETFLAGLRTNEDDDPSAERFVDFGAALVRDGATVDLAPWVDVEELITYSVVDRTIRHDDGPYHWYCFEACGNHNYYWYEHPETGRFHLIAWDLDNAFENLRQPNPITAIADAWGWTQNDCQPYPYGPFNVPQRSAACDPLFAALVAERELYDEVRAEFVSGPLSPDAVEPLIERWADLIEPHVAEASRLHDDAPSVEEWRAALGALVDDLDKARR